MCNNKECANYLKNNPAYERLMKELQKKWRSYGRVVGSITLKNASESEQRAIGGIVGKTLKEETVKVSFQEFEQGLQKTRFAPIDMKLVFEAYFEDSLCTNKEQKVQEQMAKDDFFDTLFLFLENCAKKTSVAVLWISELQKQKKYGYKMLMKEFGVDSEKAEILAKNVCKALIRLEEMDSEECLLAVFSATISGNPHYFDRGTTASQLLTHAICFWKKYNYTKKAYEWREYMQEVGIVSDNIASMVHAFGVQLVTKEGMHPACEAFIQRREPYVLTLENLKSIIGAKAKKNVVYIVENEMVFLHLIEKIREQDITLLCTSGQLRVAAFQLLDAFVKDDVVIYYSGDLDADGMDIADRLWQRYGDKVRMWRMDVEDYNESISQELLSERQLAKIEHLKNPTLNNTAEFVRKKKRAGYQENLLEQLLRDIMNNQLKM